MLKDALQTGLKKFLIKKVKNTVPWTYIINDLNGEEIIGTFYKQELQKTNQQEIRKEKLRKKVIKYMSNGKVMIIHIIAGWIKKTESNKCDSIV